MLTSIQLLLLIIIFFGLSRVLLRVREKIISRKTALFWVLLWVLVAIIILLPNTTNIFAEKLGVGRGADIVIYLSSALLFYLIFKLYVSIENLRQELTTLVRNIALEKYEKKMPGKHKKRQKKNLR